MSEDHFQWIQEDNQPVIDGPSQTPPPARWRRFLYGLIAILLVVGLLGSSIAGLFWLYRQSETAVIANPTSEPQSTATPSDPPLTVATDPDILIDPLSPNINRIVYITPDRQIATIDPDGENKQILTDTDLVFQFPAWSPDGTKIAAIGGKPGRAGVYVMPDIDNPDPEPRDLYDSRRAPIYLYWSPDSQIVSFIAQYNDGLALHLAPVEGDETARFITTGQPFYWHWSQTANQLLIHTGFSGNGSRLALLDALGDEPAVAIAEPGFFQAPGISADGRYLAYAESLGNGMSTLVIDDTEAGTQQQQRHAGLVALGWSPVGTQLAFISAGRDEQSFFGPLRLFDPATGDVELISRDRVLSFFWSPDGRYLAILTPARSLEDGINAFVPESDLAVKSVVAKPVQQSGRGQINLSVIDMVTGEDRFLTTFEPTRLFVNQFLPYFDQYALSHRIWSPDSNSLVLPMRENGRNRIFVVPVDGGGLLELGNGDMPFWSQN